MEATVEQDGTLLELLKELHPHSSTTTLRKMLTQGRVTVNTKVAHRAKHEVVAGDIVNVLPRSKAEERTPPAKAAAIDINV